MARIFFETFQGKKKDQKKKQNVNYWSWVHYTILSTFVFDWNFPLESVTFY